MKKLYCAESVSEGHPDKIADYIADSILDSYIIESPNVKAAIEIMLCNTNIFICGEVDHKEQHFCINDIAQKAFKEVSTVYDNDFQIITNLRKQSVDISMGIHKDKQGAGDQGIIYGYACNETSEFLPTPIVYCHNIMKKLASLRKDHNKEFLLPDGKSLITCTYENDKIISIDTIVISQQHKENINEKEIKSFIIEEVLMNLFDDSPYVQKKQLHNVLVNPTGRFVKGGTYADTGLTGRKLAVDTYGSFAHHGGGALSGKDTTKVDRSASYMARYIAKNLVASGIARWIEIQVSYAIGIATPLSIGVELPAENKIPAEKIEQIIHKVFDLTPKGIEETLQLRKPIYKKTTNYGHFGKSNLPWEKIDKIKEIQQLL